MYALAQNPWSLFSVLWVLIILIIALIPAIAAMYVISIYIRLVNEGKKLQAMLNTVYLDVQNHLSHSTRMIGEMIQVNKDEVETLKRALHDAITGRYTRSNSQGQGAFLNFLQENYPDLHTFNASYNRIDAVISQSRTAFTQMQGRLISELRVFEEWRTGTFMARLLVKQRFPDDDLIARTGGNNCYGKDALEKMYQIVRTSEGLRAYQTGIHDPTNLY